MTVDALRAPDSRFEKLPNYSFAPNYIDDLPGYEGLRAHYIDVGPRDAKHTFFCLHGEPTWAYLYRKMIPIFTAAGHRVVAPDFFGFGRSDKPIDEATYTFDFHRDYLVQLIERLNLRSITLVVQDWGGLLGLTLPVHYPDRIDRMIVMNTTLGLGILPSEGFSDWKGFVAGNPDFDVAELMQRAVPTLTSGEAAAYGAPFPDTKSQAGVRRFPELVPITPEMDGVELSRKAADFLSNSWSGKAFMAIGMQDVVLGPPVMTTLREMINGCSKPLEIPEAGHFVQEHGDIVARAALEYFGV